MAKHEMDMSQFKLNGVDLSCYASNLDFSHCDEDAEGKANWGEYLSGLKSASMEVTFDNSDGLLDLDMARALLPAPKYRVSYEVPDGKWQMFKHRLKNWSMFGWTPFGRLRVRYVTYSFDAVLEQWTSEQDATFRTGGAVVRDTEERR